MGKKKKRNKKQTMRQSMTQTVVLVIVVSFLAGAVFSAFKLSGVPTGGGTSSANVDGRIESLKAQLQKNPDNGNAWIQLGNAYFDSDRYQLSIEAYTKALKIYPNNANVITDMGVMYRRSGQPEKAIEAFDRAIAADPKHETSRMNKGIVLLYDMNDTKRAVAAWEGLLEINPFKMMGNGKSLQDVVDSYK